MAFCYSTGAASGGTFVGGLVGHNSGEITDSYSIGYVTGSSKVGGLVGKQEGGLIAHSFWDIETSGRTDSAGGVGKTTTEMQAASTFIGYWGCNPVWTINEGVDYPRLAWQNMPGALISKPSYIEGSGTETMGSCVEQQELPGSHQRSGDQEAPVHSGSEEPLGQG